MTEYFYECNTENDRACFIHFIEILEEIGCQFFACPGADKPYKDMATCFVCYEIQSLRQAIVKFDERIIERNDSQFPDVIFLPRFDKTEIDSKKLFVSLKAENITDVRYVKAERVIQILGWLDAIIEVHNLTCPFCNLSGAQHDPGCVLINARGVILNLKGGDPHD